MTVRQRLEISFTTYQENVLCIDTQRSESKFVNQHNKAPPKIKIPNSFKLIEKLLLSKNVYAL